jgi:hypothetical protein
MCSRSMCKCRDNLERSDSQVQNVVVGRSARSVQANYRARLSHSSSPHDMLFVASRTYIHFVIISRADPAFRRAWKSGV